MGAVAETTNGDLLLNHPYRNLVFRISKVYICFYWLITRYYTDSECLNPEPGSPRRIPYGVEY